MNITLIGMAGVGKSIIGKELAERLGFQFIDVDEKIKNKAGLKLQQIIDNLGEGKFLEIEEKTILELGKIDKRVISPGGSAIYSEKAMKFLKKNSVIIFLNASFKTINSQITNQSNRGIIGLKNKGLKAIFKERLPLYKKYADIIIEIPEDFNIEAIIKNIIQKIFNKK